MIAKFSPGIRDLLWSHIPLSGNDRPAFLDSILLDTPAFVSPRGLSPMGPAGGELRDSRGRCQWMIIATGQLHFAYKQI